VRDRRAEQGEDACRVLDRFDHHLQRRIDNRACFLGIEALLKLGRSFNIGE